MSGLTMNSKRKLRDGNAIPLIGFGSYELDGPDCYRAVTWALEAGYRHIDSAEWYENEKECGQAILDFCSKSNTLRSEIFYTTKLKLNDGYASVRASIQKSLDVCGLGYIDLYLIHGPLGGKMMREESWKAVVDAQRELAGGLRSVGVSTYGVGHLEELEALGLGLPVVHQIDLHPFMERRAVVKWCKERDITLEAWAPLVRGTRFDHPSISTLATKYKKEPAQILIRYSIQQGYVPLPKSSSQARIVSNTHVFDFELSAEEVAHLSTLDENLVTDWDPSTCA